MSHTLAELRRELARSLDSYVTGYVASATALTMTDDDLLKSGRWADDHFIGADLYIVEADGAAPEGENKYVTDFDAATGKITFGTAFDAVLQAGDQYELYQNVTVAELNQALMFAVKDWRFTSSDDVVEGISQYEITASGINSANQITGVFIRNSQDEDDGYYPITNYRLWESAGTVYLEILNAALLTSNYYYRIEYLAEYNNLKNTSGAFLDTATVGGDLNRHMLMAKRYFYDRRMNIATPIDREWYAGLLRFTTEEIEKKESPPRRRAGRMPLQDWGDGLPL